MYKKKTSEIFSQRSSLYTVEDAQFYIKQDEWTRTITITITPTQSSQSAWA